VSGRLTRTALRALDSVARFLPQPPMAAHLQTGRSGEEAAYFHLRQNGYTMVARNFRSARRRGEIDLIGWDGETLCFVEVKTRSRRDFIPAEAAVDLEKQRELVAMAREYLRRLHRHPPCRFDIVSIYAEAAGRSQEITLFKDAFVMP